MNTNLAGPAAAMAALAQVMRHQGSGRIVVLSSVAGVRVRQANLVYGASKAGLDGFALALGASLQGTGVKVTVVRPGFVRTKMTRDLDPAPFAVDADAVAAAIVRGLETGADVIWVPSDPAGGLCRAADASGVVVEPVTSLKRPSGSA